MFAFQLRNFASYKNNDAMEIKIAAHYSRPSKLGLRKRCTNINQPYLIWAAVLCRHVPPTKDQGYWDQKSNVPRRRYVYIHDVVVVVVVDVDALELLQR